jgi:hypothetical protein
MTDFLNRFGVITGTLATTSENTLDFGDIDDRAAMRSHRTGEASEETVVFSASGVGAAVSVTVKLQDSDDDSTFTDLVSGQAVKGPAGDFAWLPFPKVHKRYVRAAIGTALAAGSVSARIEPGTAKPRG